MSFPQALQLFSFDFCMAISCCTVLPGSTPVTQRSQYDNGRADISVSAPGGGIVLMSNIRATDAPVSRDLFALRRFDSHRPSSPPCPLSNASRLLIALSNSGVMFIVDTYVHPAAGILDVHGGFGLQAGAGFSDCKFLLKKILRASARGSVLRCCREQDNGARDLPPHSPGVNVRHHPGEDGMITVTDANFEADVRRATLPVLVDFWAPWCPPCGALATRLEALAGKVAGRFVIATANVAECRSLPTRLGVLLLPTLILFVSGNEVARILGVPSRATLNKLIASAGLSAHGLEDARRGDAGSGN